MRTLILGGTQFIGRHIAETLLASGHTVTILTRGRTPDPLPASVERLHGDRDAADAGVGALEGRSWDACIDVCGYTPRQVRPMAEFLRDRIGRYLFVSAVSVYGDPTDRPVQETHPLLPPADEDVTEIDGDTYGPLKVACERIVEGIYGDRCALLRPQIVVGPHDPSGRYAYWQQRAARGGELLAPGDGNDHVQVVDVRDLARFAATVIEHGLSGAFNMAGPRLTWVEFLDILGATGRAWVDAALLAALHFMELPLFRPEHGPRAGLMDVSTERARAAGLVLTDPSITERETRAWSLSVELPEALTPEREAALIARSRA